MMSFNEFENAIDQIEKAASKAMDKHFNDTGIDINESNANLIPLSISLLAKNFNDDAEKWIKFYVYGRQFGNTKKYLYKLITEK